MADSTSKIDHDQIRESAGKYGDALLGMGLDIEEVVHEYGDVCQTITELAVELSASVPAAEFRVMNLCLDDAIAQAVTHFASHSNHPSEGSNAEPFGKLGREMRTVLASATTSFAIIRRGQVGPGGTTGMVLDRSLAALGVLIERALAGATPVAS